MAGACSTRRPRIANSLAALHSASAWLLEKTAVDRRIGRIVNANVAEYLLPVNADVPDIRAILVPNDERISHPLGTKGIGELPMVGAAAAIANAVYRATGKRVRKVPICIEDALT